MRGRLPSHIDRSVWGGRFSGANGGQIMAALRYLELIDADNRPLAELERLVDTDGNDRRVGLKAILERAYAPLFELDLERATKLHFTQKFRQFGTAEQVLLKSERFFIHAARDAGVKLSDYISKGRHGNAGTRAQRTRREPSPARAPSTSNPRVRLAELWLAKMPVFDPNWDAAVQAKWFDAMSRWQEQLEHLIGE